MSELIISTYLVGLIYFITLWLLSLLTKKSSVIDIGWGFFFSVISVFYILYYQLILSLEHKIALALVVLWSCRLGIYLLIRYLHENEEDKRYAKLKKKWNATQFSFIKMFVFQGFIASSMSFPFYLIYSRDITINNLFYAGIIIGIISLFLESIADYQLFSFKKKPSNKGKVLNNGLWHLSRHPNYFFEWMVWVSIGLICLSLKGNAYIGIYAPTFMYITLNHLSGIPFLEEKARQGIYTKEGEEKYYKTTPAFFPNILKLIHK
ncbi:MAG: hypothetical protein CME69_01590 [Halobacteriovorax sp.]|nr:hypothetical protein [Halobacteriovorax sp.]|tara:strand:- start:506 stop:1297 length:792 start_codon:yes stop_codon:yes gene_type:complete